MTDKRKSRKKERRKGEEGQEEGQGEIIVTLGCAVSVRGDR